MNIDVPPVIVPPVEAADKVMIATPIMVATAVVAPTVSNQTIIEQVNAAAVVQSSTNNAVTSAVVDEQEPPPSMANNTTSSSVVSGQKRSRKPPIRDLVSVFESSSYQNSSDSVSEKQKKRYKQAIAKNPTKFFQNN